MKKYFFFLHISTTKEEYEQNNVKLANYCIKNYGQF